MLGNSELLLAVLLTASVCSAQSGKLAAAGCSTGSQSIACLPSAPSTVRPVQAYAGTAAVEMAIPSQPLSPAERPYRPLTPRKKFLHFTRSLYSPYTFVSGAYDAAWGQATGSNYAYGGGMEGFGKRMGAAYAGAATRQFFGYYLFPTWLHQDPRYFPLYHGSVLARMKHALARLAVTRSDDGRIVLNTSGLLGIAATSAAENLWLPYGQRNAADTANRFLGSLQGTASSYLLREFTPDLIRVFKKHSPKSLRKMENKIPQRVITGTPAGEE
jgi:hypothetical protein